MILVPAKGRAPAEEILNLGSSESNFLFQKARELQASLLVMIGSAPTSCYEHKPWRMVGRHAGCERGHPQNQWDARKDKSSPSSICTWSKSPKPWPAA